MSIFTIKKIFVPVDFSITGEKVLDEVVLLANLNKAEVILFTSLEAPTEKWGPEYIGVAINNVELFKTILSEWTQKNMEETQAKLKKAGVDKVSYKIGEGAPYKAIVKAAKDAMADIIVMGTHGVSGFREFSVGSNTARVVSEAKCPVLSIQKHPKKAGFANILVPFRDKPHAREGVDAAIDLANLYGASIQVLGISTDPDDSAKHKLQLEAEQIKHIAGKRGVKATAAVVKDKFVAKNILAYAEKNKADLIVLMADLDKEGISEYVMGPVIQQVVNHSPVPILSIHPLINPNMLVSGNESWSFV